MTALAPLLGLAFGRASGGFAFNSTANVRSDVPSTDCSHRSCPAASTVIRCVSLPRGTTRGAETGRPSRRIVAAAGTPVSVMAAVAGRRRRRRRRPAVRSARAGPARRPPRGRGRLVLHGGRRHERFRSRSAQRDDGDRGHPRQRQRAEPDHLPASAGRALDDDFGRHATQRRRRRGHRNGPCPAGRSRAASGTSRARPAGGVVIEAIRPGTVSSTGDLTAPQGSRAPPSDRRFPAHHIAGPGGNERRRQGVFPARSVGRLLLQTSQQVPDRRRRPGANPSGSGGLRDMSDHRDRPAPAPRTAAARRPSRTGCSRASRCRRGSTAGAAALLRRHVQRRAQHAAGPRLVRGLAVACASLAMPKSSSLTIGSAGARPVGTQEDVVGLEVAVDDALLVRGRQRARRPAGRSRARPACRRPAADALEVGAPGSRPRAAPSRCSARPSAWTRSRAPRRCPGARSPTPRAPR